MESKRFGITIRSKESGRPSKIFLGALAGGFIYLAANEINVNKDLKSAAAQAVLAAISLASMGASFKGKSHAESTTNP